MTMHNPAHPGEIQTAAEEADRLAYEKHPDETPSIRYISIERAYRIYAESQDHVLEK